jgi:HAD superfamily phosphatase (TIGR01668 family)
MSYSLLPTMTADALTDIHPELLLAHGVQLLMLDFDNTIVPYTTNNPTPLMASWLTWVKDCGIRICVVSNSKRGRVRAFCKKYRLNCITHAKKPGKKGILECMEKFDAKPQECMLVGDQIFTDTLAANRCGIKCVLVKAIDNHTFWLKLRGVAELPFRAVAKKRRIGV